MTHVSAAPFVSIGQILAEKVLPRLHRTQNLPLRVSCLGTISYAGANDADCRDRTIPLGDATSPEDAMALAAIRLARDDIRIDPDDTLHFQPRLIVVQDNALGLVIAGDIRAGVILWQHPVASDREAQRIVTEASRIRGLAFAASGRGDHGSARDLRYQASRLEARLVDPLWRETAADLLRMPQAA